MHCKSKSTGLLAHYTYLYQEAPGAHDCAAVNARGGLDLSQQSDGVITHIAVLWYVVC